MLEYIEALGCSNVDSVILAHQTYQHLTLVENLSKVSCHYNSNLDILYIESNEQNDIQTYIPIHSSSSISLAWIQAIQNELSQNDPKSIVLIIRDADSNLVQYKLTDGFVLPAIESNRSIKAHEVKTLKKRKLSESY